MDVASAVKCVSSARKESGTMQKPSWWQWSGTVDDVGLVQIKAYGTWIQIIQSGDRKGAGPPDCTHKAMLDYVEKYLHWLAS